MEGAAPTRDELGRQHGWIRKFDAPPFPKHEKFSVGVMTALSLAPLGMRMMMHVREENKLGRASIINPFDESSISPGPVGGVPLGGIGSGTITRGWRGDFNRWSLKPGMYHHGAVAADAFSARVEFGTGQEVSSAVMLPGDLKPKGGALSKWGWGSLDESRSTYRGLFPQASTVYEGTPHSAVTLTCEQISPVLPHDYRSSCLPATVFRWRIKNNHKQPARVSLMFTWQNGTGEENDAAGGHSNQIVPLESGGCCAVLHHTHRQRVSGEGGGRVVTDPLTFAIAAECGTAGRSSYHSRFVTGGDGGPIWDPFHREGRLADYVDATPSRAGETIGAAVCIDVPVLAGEEGEAVFSLAWDMPLARFMSMYSNYVHIW